MLLRTNNHEGFARRLPSSGTSHTVDIFILAHRQVVVYHVVYFGNVQSACGKVGAHKHSYRLVGKAVDSLLSLLLVESAMQTAHGETLVGKVSAHALHTVAIVHEHNRLLVAEAAQHLCQYRQLVLLGRLNRIESDAVGRLFLVDAVVHTLCASHAHKRRHLLGICGRKQDATLHIGQTLHSLLHLGTETHAQALVKLVDYEPLHVVHREVELVDMVVQSSWGAEHNLWSGAHDGAMLVHCWASSVEAFRAQSAAHASEHIVRLHGKFASRHNHHGLHLVHLGVETRGDGQQIGKGLSAARRSEHHHVAVGMEHSVDSVVLHGVEFFDMQLL